MFFIVGLFISGSFSHSLEFGLSFCLIHEFEYFLIFWQRKVEFLLILSIREAVQSEKPECLDFMLILVNRVAVDHSLKQLFDISTFVNSL